MLSTGVPRERFRSWLTTPPYGRVIVFGSEVGWSFWRLAVRGGLVQSDRPPPIKLLSPSSGRLYFSAPLIETGAKTGRLHPAYRRDIFSAMEGIPGFELPEIEYPPELTTEDADLWLSIFPEEDLFAGNMGFASSPIVDFSSGTGPHVAVQVGPESPSKEKPVNQEEMARPRQVQLDRYRYKRSRRGRKLGRARARNGRVAGAATT